MIRRISLITDGITPYVIGGMQKHSYYLAKYFAQSGIQVDLYHTNHSDLDIQELEVFTGEEKKHIRSFVIPFPQADKLPGHYIRSSRKYAEEIFEIFKKQEPTEFIIAKGFAGWKLIEEKNRGFKCAPIGVNFHGYEMFQPAPDFKNFITSRLLLRAPVAFNMKHADYLFSYGGKITTLLKKLGIPSGKIIEVSGGIEAGWLTKEISKAQSPRKFVFIGRYERRKGIEELSEVLTNIDTNGIEFHFVGPVPAEKQLKKNGIIYHGEMRDTSKIKEVLQSCDALVCPSHSEGMPNVILEGMAAGLAIIATDVGAVSMMVSQENGLLIQPADKVQLLHAINSIRSLSDHELQQLKLTSRNLVSEKFLWERIIHETIALITAKIN